MKRVSSSLLSAHILNVPLQIDACVYIYLNKKKKKRSCHSIDFNANNYFLQGKKKTPKRNCQPLLKFNVSFFPGTDFVCELLKRSGIGEFGGWGEVPHVPRKVPIYTFCNFAAAALPPTGPCLQPHSRKTPRRSPDAHTLLFGFANL